MPATRAGTSTPAHPIRTTQEETCLSVPWLPLAPRCSWPRSRSPVVARAATAAATRPDLVPARTRSPRSASSRPCPATCPPSARASSTRSSSPSSRRTTPRRIPGWTLEVAPVDDEAKPDVGKNGATKLAGDDDVVGVVGNLNSSVDASRPSRSSPPPRSPRSRPRTPARPSPWAPTPTTAPKRQYPSFFRTCTTDLVQGKFAAKFLMDQEHHQGRDDPRQEDLRPGPGRGVHRRTSRRWAAQIVAAETINRGRRQLQRRHHQGQAVEPGRSSTSAASTRRVGPCPSR